MPEGKRLELAVTVVGTVPLGGGVSSSASLAVAMGTFLQGVFSSAGVSPLSSKVGTVDGERGIYRGEVRACVRVGGGGYNRQRFPVRLNMPHFRLSCVRSGI